MYKLLVCGSRLYDDQDTVNRVLDAILAKKGKRMVLITGGAVGADELARRWACSRKVDHVVRYAKWELEGKASGALRNRRMIKMKPNRVVAFMVSDQNENVGTKDMIRVAQGAGVKVKRFF